MVIEAVRPLGDFPLVAFDTETTGLSPAGERVVELAAVRLERGTREEFSFLVDPGVPIPPGAQRVHGISDAMVKGRPPLARVLPDFLEFASGAVWVAHNAPFDIGFLAVGLQRAGLPLPDAPVLDSLELARALQSGPANYKLSTLIRFLRLPGGEAHRALGDAAMCLALTTRLLDEHGLAAQPLSRALALAAARPGFSDHDPDSVRWPLPLEPLRGALRERRPVTLSWKDFGREERAAGTARAFWRDERGGAEWILFESGGRETAIRLDRVRAVEAA